MEDTTLPKTLSIAILTARPNSFSSQRLREAAIARNHNVTFVNSLQAQITDNPQTSFCNVNTSIVEFDAVIPRIGAPLTNLGVSYLRLFEMANAYSTGSSHGVYLSRDKLLAIQTLKTNSLPVPKTVTIADNDSIDSAISYVGGPPLIIKLLNGSQGKSVMLAETDMGAKSLIQTLINMREAFIIQEFVKEASGTDIRLMVVGGEVVGAIQRTAQAGEFRSNLHQGGRAEEIKTTTEERRTAVKAARILGLNVAGVDMLRSHTGPKILEVNSSPGLQGIETATGKDIAGTIIQSIEANVHSVIRSK